MSWRPEQCLAMINEHRCQMAAAIHTTKYNLNYHIAYDGDRQPVVWYEYFKEEGADPWHPTKGLRQEVT